MRIVSSAEAVMASRAPFIILLLALLLAACGESSSDSTSKGDASDGHAEPVGDASCTYGGQRWELPSGPCAQAPICGISLKSPCPDGGYIVYSNLWDCHCTTGEWACEIIQSGLNLPLCPDAGVDPNDAAAEAG